MDLIDLLTKIGVENIEYQVLNECIVGCKKCKTDNELTFVTKYLPPEDILRGSGKVGIVVWVDMEDINKNVS